MVVIDEQDRVRMKRKQANVLREVLTSLEPYRGPLVGIVMESTYNWYWLLQCTVLPVMRNWHSWNWRQWGMRSSSLSGVVR